jgi:cytochrome c
VAFIKANMPLGNYIELNYIELTDQEAWDVAAGHLPHLCSRASGCHLG